MKTTCTILVLATALMPALAQAQTADPVNRTQRVEERHRDRTNRNTPDWGLFVSSGLFFATGDYGRETRTNSYTVPLSARLGKGPLRLSATLPYLRINGSRTVIGGGNEGPIIDDPVLETQRDLRKGFGDLSLRARYRVAPRSWNGLELDLLGRVKLPTGSRRKRLSTGETDYAVGGELSYGSGAVQPFVELQYRINGDPRGRDYRNTFASSVGASTRVGRGIGTLSYDYSGPRFRGLSGAHSLDAGLSLPVSRALALGGFGSVGLSKRADDFSIGSVLTARVF